MHVENSLFSTHSVKTMETDSVEEVIFKSPVKKLRFEIKAMKANRFG